MNENNIDVYLSMQENVTQQMPGVINSLASSRGAMREVAMGANYLGNMFLGMGVAMRSSNDAALNGVSNMLTMVGGIMSAVSSAGFFVNAIAKMTEGLQKFNIAQILANALSGPGGWAKLLIGGAAAGAAIYGTTKALSKAGGTTKEATVVNNYHIGGSVVSERQLVDNVQRGMLVKQDRSYSVGLNR